MRARPRARQINFFGNRLIVCQITGKNGAEFKNDVENRFCGRALGRAKSTFFGNRLVVCQITSKNGADYKNDVVAGEQTRAKRGFLRVALMSVSCRNQASCIKGIDFE